MLGLSDTAGAINELPDIGVPETTSATGTMDATADPPHIPQQSVHETVQCSATASEQDTIIHDCPEDPNQLGSAELSDDMQLDATPDEKAGEGTRTLNIQLGRLTACLASADESSTSKRGKPNPRTYPSSQAQNISNSDTDLVALINAWATLPDEAKTTILMIMKASRNA